MTEDAFYTTDADEGASAPIWRRPRTEEPNLLLAGLDSLYICYYLDLATSDLDFPELETRKLMLAEGLDRNAPVQIGSELFILKPYGAKPYRYVLSNADFEIALGERISPSMKVHFSSKALWHQGAASLHQRIIEWAQSIRALAYKPETVSRADWAFDFDTDKPNIAHEHIVSRAQKIGQWIQRDHVQSVQIGTGDTVVRLYDKVAEIKQASDKSWFYELWGQSENVWRIEFQVRRERLKHAGINAFADLESFQGDLLRELSHHHTTLRKPTPDSNRSRWPLHPLWKALQAGVADLSAFGLVHAFDDVQAIEYRKVKLLRSMYGYTKGLAALLQLQQADPLKPMNFEEVLEELPSLFREAHVPSLWQQDVLERIEKYWLGQW